MICDPNVLLARARCFKCIPRGMQKEVQIYLLCQWLKKKAVTPPPPSYPCGVPSNTIQISGAGTAAINQNYTNTSPVLWTSQDGIWFLSFEHDAWIITNAPGNAESYYPSGLFPCEWFFDTNGEHYFVDSNGDSPAPTGKYV